MSERNARILAEAWPALLNPRKIAVYENPPGNWVKNFYGQRDPLVLPVHINPTTVNWFDDKEKALDFWALKSGYALQ